jgi:NADP-dependent 3-hydroxy acid dehydrogenase YdfG
MYNPYSLQGKTILVTGASSGIGQSVAIECSKMGATVVITGRNKDRLQETYDMLEGSGHIRSLPTCQVILKYRSWSMNARK